MSQALEISSSDAIDNSPVLINMLDHKEALNYEQNAEGVAPHCL